MAHRDSLSAEVLVLKIVDRKNFDLGCKQKEDVEDEDDEDEEEEKSDTFIMDKFDDDNE